MFSCATSMNCLTLTHSPLPPCQQLLRPPATTFFMLTRLLIVLAQVCSICSPMQSCLPRHCKHKFATSLLQFATSLLQFATSLGACSCCRLPLQHVSCGRHPQAYCHSPQDCGSPVHLGAWTHNSRGGAYPCTGIRQHYKDAYALHCSPVRQSA
jgi:hypothetical protein